jgi:outer membrane protein OmpA-like peptidoglycan-associated protein/tetratricopeptide (TPR) repeat protein
MSSIRSVLIFLTLLALTQHAFSQQDPKELAREYMTQAELILQETKAMDDAREIMVTAADLDTTFLKANYQAAHMHFLTINKAMAVKYLLRVYRQDPEYHFDIEFWIGRAYQYGLEFEKAIEYYNRYKEKLQKRSNYQGKDKRDVAEVDRAIFECQNGLEYVSKPGNFSIVNIGREINSEYIDYGPVLNEAEDQIVFTSRRRDGNMNENVADDNKPWEDIFISKKVGGKWEFAKNIGPPINNAFHNSNLALSADGNTLFLFNDDGNGDIYYSEYENGQWSAPQTITGINSTFEEKSITISSDESTLYFSSDRPGGYGGLDIYRATKDTKGNWSNIKNLGPKINSDHDDDGPFIDYDGVTLYFSSKGRKGMGGFDVFKSTYNPNQNEWSEPENLGYPINTPDDDIYFVTSKDSKRAYYSSVREDGMGYNDIYMITIPEGLKNVAPVATRPVEQPKDTSTVATVTPNPVKEPVKEPVKPKTEPKKELIPLRYVVSVVDVQTGSPINAKVKMAGASDNIVVGVKNVGGGVFEFNVNSKAAKDYRLSVESDGYAFQNLTVRVDGASTQEKTLTRKVEMRKLEANVVSVLRNIYFDFDRATFKTESYGELNKLEAMLRQNPNLTCEIGGHTDAVGTKAYNLFLSRKRAEAVKDYLTKKGIDTRRIKAVGYGKSKPLVSNDDEDDGRELNRRVEFKVLSN